MDLSNLDTIPAASAGVVMPVLHPTSRIPLLVDDGEKKGQPITITCIGGDSPEFRAILRKLEDERLNGKSARLTAEQVENEVLSRLVACVKGWSNITLDGEELTFTPANVKAVLTRFLWLQDQVSRFIGDRSNFLKASQTS